MLLNIIYYLLVKPTLVWPLMAGGHGRGWKNGLGSCGLRWYETLVGEEDLVVLLWFIKEVTGGHNWEALLAVYVVDPCVIVGGEIYLVY